MSSETAAVRYDGGPAGRSLTGRTALVTGGGSGLGRAIARRLAAGGATVVVADIDADGAADTVKLVTEAGGQARDISLDVADPQSVATAVAAVFEEFGDSVDLLVNNAGTDRGAGILDLTEEQWQHVIGVNQSGPLYMTREFLRPIVAGGPREFPADVVNVISISAITVRRRRGRLQLLQGRVGQAHRGDAARSTRVPMARPHPRPAAECDEHAHDGAVASQRRRHDGS